MKFIKHNAFEDAKVNNYNIVKGQTVLKIIFSDSDIHISRNGKKHLDIWGSKLQALKKLLVEK